MEYMTEAARLTMSIKQDMELCIAIRENGSSPVQVANNMLARQAVKIDALEARIASLEDKLREGI